MTLKPLEIPKNSLSKFKKTIQVWKDELNRKLAQKETISSSDEHWFEAHENIEITGGDNDIVIEPRPTRCKVLKAVLTIGACIEDLNDPNACKLEALLGSLNRQLCLDKTWGYSFN